MAEEAPSFESRLTESIEGGPERFENSSPEDADRIPVVQTIAVPDTDLPFYQETASDDVFKGEGGIAFRVRNEILPGDVWQQGDKRRMLQPGHKVILYSGRPEAVAKFTSAVEAAKAKAAGAPQK